jgi:hypothetical protein
MKKLNFTDSQIMAAIKNGESAVLPPDVCRELGASAAPLTTSG